MALITRTPHMRFEHQYHGTLTVLEGAELSGLLSRFFWHLRRRLSKNNRDFMPAFIEAVCLAYRGLHQVDVLNKKCLTELKDPDARKLDLFYRGMLLIFCMARDPDRNWEKMLARRKPFREILNDILHLKPNLFGVGIDLNRLFDHVAGNRDEETGDE